MQDALVPHNQANSSTEYIVRTVPLTVRRRVKWGECDPAGVVYTVVFAEYVMSAADLFYSALFDSPPQRAKETAGFLTPSRALSLEFESWLKTDDEFDMIVTVDEVRKHTYVLNVEAKTASQVVAFRGTLTPICLSPQTRRAIELPRELRARLESYRAACARAKD